MKIEDIGKIIKDFLSQEDSYTTILIDGAWGCGKTTQVRKSIDECDNKDIIYVSLFGIKSTNELSNCYDKGVFGKVLGNLAAIGTSAIPIVGNGISAALSNVLDQYSDVKKAKKKKVFIFDDLERVDKDMSLVSLLGFFNTLVLNDCKVLCLSSLDEITGKKREDFDRFTEKAFDRVYHIDEKPQEVFERIFSGTGINNISRITDGFGGNIRLAKRTALLFKNADKAIEAMKDKEHDFYQNYSKEELLYSSMVAIKILYLNVGDVSFTESQKQSYKYELLKEHSGYFGEKVSNRFISEYIDKKDDDEHSVGKEYCLTRDLIYLEMFNNTDLLKEDSQIVTIDKNDENSSLFSGSFYYLNDRDKKRFVSVLSKGIKSKKIAIDSALMIMIGEVCTYSSLPFSKGVISIIVDNIVSQVETGNSATFSKVSEYRMFVNTGAYNKVNYVETIYQNAKKRIDSNKAKLAEKNLLEAYHSKNYKYLLDFYYDLTEGKLFSERNNYVDITLRNNFFLPRLEKSINHNAWSYCHQIARYCVGVEISDKLIDFLKEYVNRYPNEKSLRDKAFAMIFYNIDRAFRIEDLDKH